MEKKYTPGPWRMCNEGRCSCGLVSSRDFTVASVSSSCIKDEGVNLGDGLSNTSEEFKANYKLIAAAPELLEACMKALIHLEHLGIEKGVQEDLRQAIRKATE
jgi:hypothetical protein